MNTQDNTNRPYVALARRYRPKTFEEFVGLEHVTRTLQNSIAQGRVGHAYLFCGPRGIGKTSMVRVFAMALNCEKGPAAEPCGKCDSCTTTHRGEGIDVIEIDGASHTGVDDVRELRERAIYAPAKSRYKIFVIDEVHMLSKSAFNALLKILEEPPSHVKFMFATTEPQKVPETIQSRCQRFDFPRISSGDITRVLERVCRDEGIAADENSLAHIARNVRGGLRDALSTLDQLIAYDGRKIQPESVYKVMGSVPEEIIALLAGAIVRADVKSAVETVNDIITKGKDSGEFVEALANFFRDVIVMRNCGPEYAGFITGPAVRENVSEAAGTLGDDTLLYIQQILGELDRKLRLANNPSLLIETTVVRLCRWRDFAAFGALLAGFKPPEGNTRERENNAESVRYDSAPGAPDETEAVSEDGPPPGDISPDDWKKAVDRLYKMRGFLGASLGNARFLGSADGTITLGFGKEGKFLLEQISDRAKREEAEKLLGEIFGRKILLKPVEIEGESPKKSPERKSKPKDPMVKKALDMFGGEIMR